jgi:hypothetical protein
MSNSLLFESHSETRPIRPYRGVSRVQKVFDEILITIGTTEIFPSTTVIVSGDDFISEKVRVLCHVDKDAKGVKQTDQRKANNSFSEKLKKSLSGTSIPIEDVYILFTASTSYLHLSEILWEGPFLKFSDALDSDIGLELVAKGANRPGALQAPQGGCDISIFAALKDERPKKTGEAWRKGTWLASAEMKIRTDRGNFGFSFTPEPLNDGIRKEFGLPYETIRYIDCPSAIEPTDTASQISVYIDEDILSQLKRDTGSNASISFQRQIAIDVITAVFYKGHKELPESGFNSFGDIEKSLCGQLIKGMATSIDPPKFDRDEASHLFRLLRENPAQLISHQEAVIDPKKPLMNILVGDK